MAKGKGRGSTPSMRGMMEQVQRMQEEMERAQEALGDEVVEASAGGGAVKIVMSGTQECKGVFIDPDLAQESDVDMLQDLVMLAINQAIQDSQQLAANKLGPLAGSGLGALGLG